MLWAALYLPQRALDAVLRRQPDPHSPLLLVDGPPQRRVVHSANAAAQAAGVQAGQALAAAQVLCPQVRVLAHDAQAAAQLLELLAAWAYRYTSQVCSDGENTLWLEIGGSLGLFGPWPRFQRFLRDDLDALGLRHRLAVAPTLLGAQTLAQAQDGLAVLDLAALERALQALPLACAPLPEPIIAALAGMGVRRLRQLLALPRAGLARRFGSGLPDMLERMLGSAPDPRDFHRPPERFEARFEFDYEVRHTPALLFPLKRLLADLSTYLASRDGGVQRFELVLEHDDHPDSTQTVGLLEPERDAGRLFELARLTLERQSVPAPVRALGVRAHELPPFVPGGRDLFEMRAANAMDWPLLQARLGARLGREAIHQLLLVDDPRPEHAQRCVTIIQGRPPAAPALPRPSWLLPRPLPWRERDPRILAGPERIESGWWDGGDVRRDYYIIENAAGQRAWVFCPPGQHGPFLLHGWFA